MKRFLLRIMQLTSASLIANLIIFAPAIARDIQEVIKVDEPQNTLNKDAESGKYPQSLAPNPDKTKSQDVVAQIFSTQTDTSSEGILPQETTSSSGEENPMAQVTSVSQLSDVQPTDWAFQALQSLVERYGVIAGYPDGTFRGNRALTRYEFAAGLNAAMDRINELIAAGSADLVREDLATLQKLQSEFAAELTTLRGRVDTLEAHAAELEANQFSTTTKLNAEVIWAATDTFGDRVGGNSDDSNIIVADRIRLNFETSFTGEDLLRTRLETSNFGSITEVTGTTMTLLNFATTDFENSLVIPHVLYRFPVSSDVSFTIGPAGVGYTDITDTLTPPSVADDSRGIPSLFGQYSPLYRQGGGGGAVNWSIQDNLVLTLGYLTATSSNPEDGSGLFNGEYNALAQLAYYGDWGALGVAYSHSYLSQEEYDLTGGAGSALARRPFGDNINTSSDTLGLQGFYRVAPKFQIHGWLGYVNANAENSGLSEVSDSRGGTFLRNVTDDSNADIWYGAIGLTFPDLGGEGNLSGILVGLPPRVTNSDVRRDPDTSYHIEAFYRLQVNDNISITPGLWVVINPENDSSNDTQYVGVIRTSFDF